MVFIRLEVEYLLQALCFESFRETIFLLAKQRTVYHGQLMGKDM